VGGHHAGLHDSGGLQSLVEDPKYALVSRLAEVISSFEREISSIPSDSVDPPFAQDELRCEFYIRMLFSCLTDADYLDTECFEAGNERPVIRLKQICDTLISRLKVDERDGKPHKGLVNAARHGVFERCLQVAEQKTGFFSLTVPTGGGKTLSGMTFALEHARRNDLRRVIVVIPYLSIIEQNATEYRRVLDPANEGIVIEHHSAVKVPECGEGRKRSAIELAAENWDAPVILTTSVQFIESLFANRGSKCRKLHNIARSVVVMDEVQTVPTRILNPLLSVLRELKQNYGVSFLFTTATQPAFRQGIALTEGFAANELIEVSGTPQEPLICLVS
jgi:CRISPR-associated endonuclease/helicase Cas3